jgi:hypothetical protein
MVRDASLRDAPHHEADQSRPSSADLQNKAIQRKCNEFSETIFYGMAGPVPAIHVLLLGATAKTWMPATRAGMTVRAEHEYGRTAEQSHAGKTQ